LASTDILQVRGNGFIRYREAYKEPGQQSYGRFRMEMDALKAAKAAERMKNARLSAYKVGLSDGSRKRLQRAITIMAAACTPRWIENHKKQLQYFRMGFLTLTFPAPIDINPAKEIFFEFMRWVRERQGIRADIWKMEFQASDIPHFHVLLSDYLHKDQAQARWDDLLRENGVSTEYADKNNTYRTNSLDIKAVGKVKDLAAYMVKELSKDLSAKKVTIEAKIRAENPDINPEDLKQQVHAEVMEMIKVNGKVWDCSMNLRGVRYFSVVMSAAHVEQLHRLEAEGRCRCMNDDFFSIIKLTDSSPPDLLSEIENNLYSQHVRAIFNKEQPPVIEIEECDFELQPDPEIKYTWQQLKMFIDGNQN